MPSAWMLPFAWLVLLHSAAFCLFWLTNRPAYRPVEEFLEGKLGFSAAYISLFIGFSLIVLACSLAAVILHPLLPRPPHKIVAWLGALYLIVGAGFIVFFYGSFAALFWQDPTQLERLKQAWRYFRLLPDAFFLLGGAWALSRLALPALRQHLPSLALPGSLAPWLAVLTLGVLWLLPFLRPPAGVYAGLLPPKPRLMAHRGASWLAPENTLAAMKRAVELGAFGLESDVHVSRDGVLFLMHDQTLKRTTDVETRFPERRDQHASLFEWAELAQLNAGTWFVQQDPYGTLRAGFASPAQMAEYARQPIPRLESLLELAAQHGQIVLYDLYDPPPGHPYHGQSLTLSLKALAQAQLGARAWVLVDEGQIAAARAALPEATLVAGVDAQNPPAPEEIKRLGYQVVNSEYPLPDDAIRAYKTAGLWINLWTVDEPWQLGRAWLLGVDSVTTNNLHTLSQQSRPYLALPLGVYRLAWTILGLLALGWMRLNALF